MSSVGHWKKWGLCNCVLKWMDFSTLSVSKQPTQLIVQLNSSLRHIIVTFDYFSLMTLTSINIPISTLSCICTSEENWNGIQLIIMHHEQKPSSSLPPAWQGMKKILWPFNLHLDFWKSRSWKNKVCFKLVYDWNHLFGLGSDTETNRNHKNLQLESII